MFSDTALLSKIPRVQKFCFCMDVVDGVRYVHALKALHCSHMCFILVRYASICLILAWIIYVFAAFLGGSNSSTWIWAIIWCGLNIACFSGVLYGLANNERSCLLPALVISVFNIIVGVINILVNLMSLNWFAFLWLLAIACLTTHYVIGLVSVREGLYSSEVPSSSQEPVYEKPQNRVLFV